MKVRLPSLDSLKISSVVNITATHSYSNGALPWRDLNRTDATFVLVWMAKA